MVLPPRHQSERENAPTPKYHSLSVLEVARPPAMNGQMGMIGVVLGGQRIGKI